MVKMNLTIVLSSLSDEERGKFASEHKLSFTFRMQRDSLVADIIKNLPVMQETQISPLRWEDPLEKGMATHSSILAWKTPWTEETGGLQSTGLQRVRHN